MSENIRGITFAEQAVTPADDAIVRRAVLGDGILTGCEITYSGSTLTMASGFIIACGRAFQITASQNWAVVDATSGVARLLLTIDLTQTATEDTFNQISFSIEYAASEDGFVDLVQEDINISGTKYQIVAAVVSLGTGGITGIVSKLEKTEGGGLNFKVVDGLTQPGSATENTIWVKTQGMTGWIIDANQPENLTEGMVWISVGTSSTVEFNALKKNGLQVYPLTAKQYISGALVDVPAMSYQGGEWVALFDGYILKNGVDMSSVTGGWNTGSNDIAKLQTDGAMYFYRGTKYPISTVNKFDLTPYSILEFKILAFTDGTNSGYQSVGIASSAGGEVASTGDLTTTGTKTIDISALSGEYSIGVWLAPGASVQVDNMVLRM